MENIFTKEKAIKHLSFLIKLNERKPNMDSAIEKWKKDRKYLSGSDGKIGIGSIIC